MLRDGLTSDVALIHIGPPPGTLMDDACSDAEPFDGVTLPEELRAAAEAQLGEDPGLRFKAVDALRLSLLELPAEEQPDVSDAALLRFLRCAKFDARKARGMALGLYAFKAKHPQYFGDVTFQRFEALAGSGAITVLPTPARGGQRCVVLHFSRLPLDTVPALELAAFFFYVAERLQWDPAVQVHGISCLSTYEGVTLSHFSRLWALIPVAHRLEFSKCFAARYGQIRIYHAPTFVRGASQRGASQRPTSPLTRPHLCTSSRVAPPALAAAGQDHVPSAAPGRVRRGRCRVRARGGASPVRQRRHGKRRHHAGLDASPV